MISPAISGGKKETRKAITGDFRRHKDRLPADPALFFALFYIGDIRFRASDLQCQLR